MTDSPLISIVVPTYNRVDRLRRVLDAIAAQTIPAEQIELIVVSDGSDDGTDAFLARRRQPRPLIPLFQENAGPAAARNHGVRHATADIVLFLDDDVIPSATLVAEHLEAHAAHHRSVVIGPMLTPEDHPMTAWVRWEQRMLYKQYDAMDAGCYTATARQFYTGNTSMPRRLFEAHDGFDERFRRAEDIELAYRLDAAGVRFHYWREARGYHYAERSFRSWCDIAYEYGRSDVVFAKYPDRAHLGEFLAASYQQRLPAMRVFTWITLATRWTRTMAVLLMSAALLVGNLARAPFVSRASLSAIHSVLYFGGMADELGGPSRFRAMMRSGGVI